MACTSKRTCSTVEQAYSLAIKETTASLHRQPADMKHRQIEIREGVQFDLLNVRETASHCRARNNFLQANTQNADQAAEALISEVLKQIHRGTFALSEMFPVYNAWCVVDSHTITKGVSHTQRLEANFFVRPGRQPRLRDANDDRD